VLYTRGCASSFDNYPRKEGSMNFMKGPWFAGRNPYYPDNELFSVVNSTLREFGLFLRSYSANGGIQHNGDWIDFLVDNDNNRLSQYFKIWPMRVKCPIRDIDRPQIGFDVLDAVHLEEMKTIFPETNMQTSTDRLLFIGVEGIAAPIHLEGLSSLTIARAIYYMILMHSGRSPKNHIKEYFNRPFDYLPDHTPQKHRSPGRSYIEPGVRLPERIAYGTRLDNTKFVVSGFSYTCSEEPKDGKETTTGARTRRRREACSGREKRKWDAKTTRENFKKRSGI